MRDPYIKLNMNFFGSIEAKKLRSYKRGAAYLIIYMKLLILRSKYDGIITYYHIENNIAEEIALDIDEEYKDVKECIKILEQLGLLYYTSPSKTELVIFKPQKNGRCSKEYRDWRKTVLERDNYTCTCCNRKGGELHAHHIEPWALNIYKRYDISNGITLCAKCHKEIHRKGYKNE